VYWDAAQVEHHMQDELFSARHQGLQPYSLMICTIDQDCKQMSPWDLGHYLNLFNPMESLFYLQADQSSYSYYKPLGNETPSSTQDVATNQTEHLHHLSQGKPKDTSYAASHQLSEDKYSETLDHTLPPHMLAKYKTPEDKEDPKRQPCTSGSVGSTMSHCFTAVLHFATQKDPPNPELHSAMETNETQWHKAMTNSQTFEDSNAL
jgi:hypothetical protein